MKKELKLVFVGNVGSGKTTGLRTLSDGQAIGTEVRATEREALHRKATTTVAMEYGVLRWDEKTKLHLYGTPGQRRFDFMLPIVCHGADGVVAMIDNGHGNPLDEIDYFLNAHRELLKKFPVVIAVTHYDDINTRTHLIEYHQYVANCGFICPVMRVDAREKNDMSKLISRLLTEIAQFQRSARHNEFTPYSQAA